MPSSNCYRVGFFVGFVLVACQAVAEDLSAALANGLHVACDKANSTANAMQVGLQQTWADNNAAQAQLTAARDKLHLASVPLQNSNCADEGWGTPICKQLDAAYANARNDVLKLQPVADSAAKTYAINLSRYQLTVQTATSLCKVAIANDLDKARKAAADNPLVPPLLELIKQISILLSATDLASEQNVVPMPNPLRPPTIILGAPVMPAAAAAHLELVEVLPDTTQYDGGGWSVDATAGKITQRTPAGWHSEYSWSPPLPKRIVVPGSFTISLHVTATSSPGGRLAAGIGIRGAPEVDRDPHISVLSENGQSVTKDLSVTVKFPKSMDSWPSGFDAYLEIGADFASSVKYHYKVVR